MRRLILAAILFCSLAGGCRERSSQQTVVRLALARSPFTYLPVYLAEPLGYYRDEKLQVEFQEFPGGAKAVESVVAGSADIAAGFFEHAIQMSATGHPFQSFLIMLRYPGMALVVSPGANKAIHGFADLKGRTVGVGTPGSPTHFFLNYLLATHGMKPDSVSVVGIGAPATAAAAIEHDKVAAAVVGAAMVVLKRHQPDLAVLAESFTPEGVKESLGVDEYPGAALLAKSDWLASHPDIAKRFARATLRSLLFIQSHTPEEILAQLPQAYRTDPGTDLATMRAFVPDYSKDGKMNSASAEAVRRVLSESLPDVARSGIDLAATWSNAFISF